MTQKRILLDPTSEHSPVTQKPLSRPSKPEGLTVGLLDISKARGDLFLDRIESRLRERGLTTRRFQKPTFARVAPTALKHKIVSECDVVIEALAD
jgi:hypothetical protein